MTRLLFALGLMALPLASESNTGSQPEEVGRVRWGRDLDAALAAGGQSGRPVFALFQEVPGCAGCRQFGRDVLSNKLLVEAIETEFTPLLIHNNNPGRDADALRRFGEPAWNYQVVRFLDREGKDIIPRRDQVWDTGGVAERMIATLEKSGRPVPAYLKLLAAEHSPRLQQAAFSMFCFWSGEMLLGRIDGVVTTQAGFCESHETVLVRYDPAVIPLSKLIASAEKKECHHMDASTGFRSAPDADQKKQLQSTKVEKLGLSAAQATKFNAWLQADPNKALEFLTPAQKSQLSKPAALAPAPQPKKPQL